MFNLFKSSEERKAAREKNLPQLTLKGSMLSIQMFQDHQLMGKMREPEYRPQPIQIQLTEISRVEVTDDAGIKDLRKDLDRGFKVVMEAKQELGRYMKKETVRPTRLLEYDDDDGNTHILLEGHNFQYILDVPHDQALAVQSAWQQQM